MNFFPVLCQWAVVFSYIFFIVVDVLLTYQYTFRCVSEFMFLTNSFVQIFSSKENLINVLHKIAYIMNEAALLPIHWWINTLNEVVSDGTRVFTLKHAILCCLLGNAAESRAVNNTVKRSPLNVSSVNCVLMKLHHISLGTCDHNVQSLSFPQNQYSVSFSDDRRLNAAYCADYSTPMCQACKHLHDTLILSLCVNTIWTLWTQFVITMICLRYFVYIFLLLQPVPLVVDDLYLGTNELEL